MNLSRVARLLDGLGRGIENFLLISSLVLMIGIAVAQIVLRNVGATGMVWADEALRLLVLWLALIGAVAASRDDHHIRIDVLSRFVPRRLNDGIRVVVDLFTAVVCAVVAWYAVRFVASTREFEDVALGSLPMWYFQIILPLGFALVSYRYALLALRHAGAFLRGSRD